MRFDVVEATVSIELAERRGVHWHKRGIIRLYFYSQGAPSEASEPINWSVNFR